MHENNRKEFELSGVIPYLEKGYTGKGWKFTTLETLGQKDRHAEYTISTYKQFRPDAEFIECPISSPWASSKIESVIDWCIENDIRTILMSIEIGTRQQEADTYNKAFKKAKDNGLMIANAIGNKNENVDEDDRLGTLSELESVGAVYWHEKLRQLKRAGYSNHSETLDYADFTSIYLPEYDLHFSGTSCASPSFNGKRDILREYLEVNYGISDYETVMKIIDENLLDLGEVGRDNYYGKGLFVLPTFEYYDKFKKGEETMIIDNIPLNTPNNRRPGTKRQVKCIVIHNTGNEKSTALNERQWLTNPQNERTASFNYVIDDIAIIQCIPDDEVTWHAGDGGKGFGNVNGLSIEICEPNLDKVLKLAIPFIASKLVEYKLTIDDVKPHMFFDGKYCPRLIIPFWDKFIQDIEVEYKKQKGESNMENNIEVSDFAKIPREELMKMGITDGTRPKELVTREEVWTMMYRLIKKESDK